MNPAEYIPFQFEDKPHDCIAEALTYSKLRPDLESTPLAEADLYYFVDGSCYRDHDGYHVGFAVMQKISDKTFVTVMADGVPQQCSVQKAELKALTEACKLASMKKANIYTDSAYAHENR